METLVCRIELDKEKGIILTVENDDDSIVQTIVMDGTSIKSKVEGSKDSSSITQTQEGVFMQCSTFVLDAETITCKSKKATQLQSGLNFDIKSKADISVEASKKAVLKAMDVSINGTVNTEVKAVKLSMEGSASAELKAASIKLESKGMLDLISNGLATLKGSLVNIKGILNLG